MTKQPSAHDSTPARVLLAMAGGVLVVSIAVVSGRADQTAAPAQTTVTAQTAQAADPKNAGVQAEEELAKVGQDLVNRTCDTSCHGLEKLDEQRRTVNDWNDQVGTMAGKGAIATDAQFTTIKKYLVRYYGLVAVNTATADELSAVMGFSAKDAQAIVAYRTAHGKFADADALSKVPGIDKTRIDEQPAALVFR